MPQSNKEKKKLNLKTDFKPFPIEFLEDTPEQKEQEALKLNKLAQREVSEKPTSKQPALLGQAFGKKTKGIEKKALNLTKEVAKAESGSGKSLFDDDDIKTAAFGLVPILLGGLLGGAEGALVGLQGAAKGIETFEKIKSDEKKQATEKELKEKELGILEKETESKEGLRTAQAGLAKAQAAKFDPVRLSQESQAKFQETQAKLSEGLRREHFQATKEIGTADVLASHSRITEVAEQAPSAAGDISLVFNFMKMNDPQSTVREGEFATAEKARGVPESIRNIYNKILEGQLLTPDQRKDFSNQAGNLLEGQLKAQERIDQRFVSLSEKQAVDPSLVVDPAFETKRRQLASQGTPEDRLNSIEEKARNMSKEERELRRQELINKRGR